MGQKPQKSNKIQNFRQARWHTPKSETELDEIRGGRAWNPAKLLERRSEEKKRVSR